MPEPLKPMKGKLPRDSGGSLELHGGTGDITAMCSCGGFLEVYKEDTTFRIKSPESIDPDRTNPNAPFVAAVSDNVGSSSQAVARVLLQGRDILETAILQQSVDKPSVVQALHACKESLVACEKVAERVASQVDRIIKEIQTSGIKRDSHGGALNPFPQVQDLESEATSFLIHARRAIQQICRVPSMFLPIPAKDTNFDALGKTLVAIIGAQAPVTDFVQANAPSVRYLIELRNYQEHPDAKRTVISNFAVTPDGSISEPMWHVSDQTPRPLGKEMVAAAEFLVDMAEALLIHLVMHTVDKRFPFIIEEIDTAQMNLKMPIKYRLSLDASKLRTDAQACN